MKKVFSQIINFRTNQCNDIISIKKRAEDYLGNKVTRSIITVSAYFTVSQKEATKQAAEITRIKVKRIINEPTAVVLAYGFDKNIEINKNIWYLIQDEIHLMLPF